ncbi:MAG: M28 family peptidase, partial [Candidatus Bathyarchaeia archaeon]
MVLTDFERKVLAEVSKEKAWEHVKWFAGVGEKLSGSPEFERSVDYILDSLKGYGIDAVALEFQAYLSFPKTFDAELKVLEPEKRDIGCIAYAQIKSTPPEGIEGELVYVGQGGIQDYSGKNVRNKITLAELSYAPPRPWKNYVAGVLKGAKGQIQINYPGAEGGIRAYGRGTVKSVWGNPTPETIEDVGRIPLVNITEADGVYLKELLEKGPVRLWMKAEATREWMRTRQPMATVKGKVPEFVLLGSHLDAWGAAVSCNAVGNASTLEVARVFNKFKSHLRRGVEFLWYTGHETGIMDGSTWYVDNFWDNLHKYCVANFNNDSVGMVHANAGYSAGGDPIFDEFLKATVKDLAEEEGVPFMARGRGLRYRPSKVGDQSFHGLGIPSGSARSTSDPEVIRSLPYRYNWWYHSDYDTLDKADPEALYMANKA